MGWLGIIGILIGSGSVLGLMVVWSFKYAMRKNPKSMKILRDKNGNILSEEIEYR